MNFWCYKFKKFSKYRISNFNIGVIFTDQIKGNINSFIQVDIAKKVYDILRNIMNSI